MVAVAAAVPPDVRKTVFIPMFERFAKDASRWVRNGAFEILGPLIHTLGSKLVKKTFLKHFTGIPSMGHSVVDAEVNYHCAYNFPAVVLTLGPHRWPGMYFVYSIHI
jgi:serine/threonine-protein phosphatase 4 regulatory subunit 1